jgi:hypothetical protein
MPNISSNISASLFNILDANTVRNMQPEWTDEKGEMPFSKPTPVARYICGEWIDPMFPRSDQPQVQVETKYRRPRHFENPSRRLLDKLVKAIDRKAYPTRLRT